MPIPKSAPKSKSKSTFSHLSAGKRPPMAKPRTDIELFTDKKGKKVVNLFYCEHDFTDADLQQFLDCSLVIIMKWRGRVEGAEKYFNAVWPQGLNGAVAPRRTSGQIRELFRLGLDKNNNKSNKNDVVDDLMNWPGRLDQSWANT